MPRTNKKEQPKCNPSTSAFFYMYKKGRTFTESRTEYGSPDKPGGIKHIAL